MFQTEIIHLLQSYETPMLTFFMRAVTSMGYVEFLLVALFTITFGIHFKKGFLLIMAFLWTVMITISIKENIGFPRPFHIDEKVRHLDERILGSEEDMFPQKDGLSFWASLPEDVVIVSRSIEDLSHGFPSGHSSLAIVFWGLLIFLFRSRYLAVLAVLAMILIPFSRIYLGVHFLGDVLGGMILGVLLLSMIIILIRREDILRHWADKKPFRLQVNPIKLLFVFLPSVFLITLPPRYFILISVSVGFALGFLLCYHYGLPSDRGSFPVRTGRIALSLLAFVVPMFLIQRLSSQVALGDLPWISFIAYLLASILIVWGTVRLSLYFNWYTRDSPASTSVSAKR